MLLGEGSQDRIELLPVGQAVGVVVGEAVAAGGGDGVVGEDDLPGLRGGGEIGVEPSVLGRVRAERVLAEDGLEDDGHVDLAGVEGIVGVGSGALGEVNFGRRWIRGSADDGTHGAGAVHQVMIAPGERERERGHLASINAEQPGVGQGLVEVGVDDVAGVEDQVRFGGRNRPGDGELAGGSRTGITDHDDVERAALGKGLEGEFLGLDGGFTRRERGDRVEVALAGNEVAEGPGMVGAGREVDQHRRVGGRAEAELGRMGGSGTPEDRHRIRSRDLEVRAAEEVGDQFRHECGPIQVAVRVHLDGEDIGAGDEQFRGVSKADFLGVASGAGQRKGIEGNRGIGRDGESAAGDLAAVEVRNEGVAVVDAEDQGAESVGGGQDELPTEGHVAPVTGEVGEPGLFAVVRGAEAGAPRGPGCVREVRLGPGGIGSEDDRVRVAPFVVDADEHRRLDRPVPQEQE